MLPVDLSRLKAAVYLAAGGGGGRPLGLATSATASLDEAAPDSPRGAARRSSSPPPPPPPAVPLARLEASAVAERPRTAPAADRATASDTAPAPRDMLPPGLLPGGRRAGGGAAEAEHLARRAAELRDRKRYLKNFWYAAGA